VKQASNIARAAPLLSHRHRGIQKLVIGQGAQESDGVEQVRFAHSIRAGYAGEGAKMNVNVNKVLEPRYF
jgi:hypothetical protein